MANVDGGFVGGLGATGGDVGVGAGALGLGGAGNPDETAPVISNLSPTPGLLAVRLKEARLTPVEFDVTDIDPGLASVVVWVKFAGRPERLLVYDGSAFVHPFISTHSAVTAIEDGLHFSVLHSGLGWPSGLEEFTVKAIDASGNVGA